MTDPVDDLTPPESVPPAPGEPPEPPESTWQRLAVPLLALLAALAALVSFGAWSLMVRTAAVPTPDFAQLGADEGPASPFRGFAIRPERPAPDFELTDQRGGTWRLSDQQGQVVALFFGYTNCPDICPQTMQRLAVAAEQLGGDADQLTVALITVDPARDTAERLGTYVEAFDPDFAGLYGAADQIQAIAQLYGVYYARDLPPAQATQAALAGEDAVAAGTPGVSEHSAASVITPGTDAYTVTHSGMVFLIDPQGQLRSSFVGSFLPEDVAHDIRALLAEQG